MVLGVALVVFAVLQANGWLIALGLCLVVSAGFVVWDAAVRRLDVDDGGLRLVAPFRSRRIRWEDVSEVRPDAHGPWATRLVAVRRDGEVLSLPVAPTDTELVERWRIAAARPHSQHSDASGEGWSG